MGEIGNNVIKVSGLTINELDINKIPVLLLSNREKIKRPIIFVFHKLLQNKKNELALAYTLASRGYFIVVMDMYGHGDREVSFDKEKKYNFNNLFKDIYNTALNVNSVLAYLRESYEEELDFNNIGSVGVSIGASVALVSGYLVKDIKYVASVVGGPCNWKHIVGNGSFENFKFFSYSDKVMEYERVKEDIERYDPITNYKNRSMDLPDMLFLNGQLDMVVPIRLATESFNRLAEHYQDNGQEGKIQFKKFTKAGHEVTVEMLETLLDWLELRNKRCNE
ncbi:MAG: alpha/beta hydrolase family protein [Clostridia bacterium]